MRSNLQCIVSAAVVYLTCFIGVADGSCDIFSGPDGAVDCELLSGYNVYQWSTCRAENSLPSGYHCLIGRYCKFSCMLEKYGKSRGSVSPDCWCTPKWCSNPDAAKCDWYSMCLQVNQTCTANVPVVEYAKQFCEAGSHDVHTSARLWHTDVKECILMKFMDITGQPDSCTLVKNTAFEEQLKTCYLLYSVCDLDLPGWASIFWTTRGLLGTAVNPGLKDLIKVTLECPNGVLHEALKFERDIWNSDSGIRLVRLVLEKLANETTGDNFDELPRSIANELATQLLWEENGILWVSFIADTPRTNEIAVNILLGSKSMYDASSPGGSRAEMNETVHDMADAFGNRKLSLNLSSIARATRFEACLDIGCNATYHDVTVKLKDATVSSAHTSYTSSGLLVSVFGFLSSYLLIQQ